jgi:7,8-dihydropterin-6-yl-methyl-4-(beta-D-ribofuranosyl)aminobenzene 5'-phosphate synthase
MGIRLVTLCENTAGIPDVMAEWGLSILIEAEGRNILMDSGAGSAAVHNAELMGIDLSKVDTIVLSHGHYDHTGGLPMILGAIGHEVPVIAHPDLFSNKYSHKKGNKDRYIGIPYQREELESLGARFNLSRQPVSITDKIMTSGEIKMQTDFEKIDGVFNLKSGEEFALDALMDDLSLYIITPLGLVVIMGCAHRGMINILRQARTLTGVEKIYMAVGGSHLKDSTPEQVWQAISGLNELGVQKLATCHCTGMPATMMLAQTYDRDFIFNQAGSMIKIDYS